MTDLQMDESVFGPVRAVLERSADDADLRERLLAGPVAAIAAETGIDLPADWSLVAVVGGDGAVVLAFDGEEIPEFMLDAVAGGASVSFSFPPLATYGSRFTPPASFTG